MRTLNFRVSKSMEYNPALCFGLGSFIKNIHWEWVAQLVESLPGVQEAWVGLIPALHKRHGDPYVSS